MRVIIMIWLLITLVNICAGQVLCDRDNLCGSGFSCCQNVKGGWSCCPYPAGVCCEGSSACCPSSYTCQSQTSSCIFDPFGFFSTQVQNANLNKSFKSANNKCIKFYQECTSFSEKLVNLYDIQECLNGKHQESQGLCLLKEGAHHEMIFESVDHGFAKKSIGKNLFVGLKHDADACILYDFENNFWISDCGEINEKELSKLYRVTSI